MLGTRRTHPKHPRRTLLSNLYINNENYYTINDESPPGVALLTSTRTLIRTRTPKRSENERRTHARTHAELLSALTPQKLRDARDGKVGARVRCGGGGGSLSAAAAPGCENDMCVRVCTFDGLAVEERAAQRDDDVAHSTTALKRR